MQFSNNTVNFLGTSSTSTTIRGFDALNTQRLYSYNLSINGSTMVKNRGVDNAMSPYNRYCCTNIKDQKIGVVLSGACNRTRMTKTTYSGVISDVGLNYIDVFIGVPHFFPGNDWSASFPNLAARYTGPGNNINRNKLIMSTNQLPFYPQGVISVPTGQPLDWFDVQPGQESTCFESSDCNDTPRPLPPNFCDVVNSQGIGGEELTWQARKFLLEDMYSNPMNSEYSDPCFQNFQLQNQNSILGILSQVSNGMKTLHNYSANIEIQMNSINVQINASNNTIKNLLEQLEIPNADSASIYTAINSQQTILAGLQQAQETLLVQHKQEVDAKAALLHSQLANLSSTNPMEQNDLFVTKLYLSSGVWGFTEISYADSSTLTSIAALCPNIGGDAVYRARAILNTTNPELVWEDATCSPQPAQTNSRKEDVIKHSSFAFPNPAQNYILVDLSKYGKNSNLSLVLTDLNHKKQLHVNPEVNSTLVKLDVNNLTNGIYILHLLKDGKSEQKEKISIIR
ncbi:MAG: T9SS type A sorting domain-containing protein [Saprospiraceae bacterium]|nr:T9SS type A sorting domain-containing protein [Saprospiraceae bacterium]